MTHAQRRTAVGLVPRHVDESVVIDYGPHRHARSREPEESVERGRRRRADREDDDPVLGDDGSTDVERLGREVRQDDAGDDRAEDQHYHCLHDQQHAHCADDSSGEAGTGQRAGHQLHHQTEHRAGDEHAEKRGDRPRHAMLSVQCVEEIRRDGRQRTMAEIEHA